MSHNALSRFLEYFDAFENSLEADDWSIVRRTLADDCVYEVEGTPFAVRLEGADAIVAGFAKSTSNFDRHLDDRGLDIVSTESLGTNTLRVTCISRYGKSGAAPLQAPVTIVAEVSDAGITSLHDYYDDRFAGPALEWLLMHAEGLDPSYA